MRAIILSLILLPITFVHAETIGEWSGLKESPTGTDLLVRLHQFDLFEEAASGTADQRGDATLRKLSKSESGAAEVRDDELMGLNDKIRLNVRFTEEPSLLVSDRLAGLQGSVGLAYVHGYYQDQVAAYESTILLLQRYVAKPDNPDLKLFAVKLTPVLKAELVAVKTAAEIRVGATVG